MMKEKINSILIIAVLTMLAIGAASCIEDGYTTSPSDQPVFSVDTLNLGTIFTDEPSPTSRFIVHNPHSKQLSISNINLSGKDASCFRLNVDGINGREFSDVDIRGKDSIFVMVEATLPEAADKAADYEAQLNFVTNGVSSSVILAARGQNVHRLRAEIIESDTRFDSELPYQIYDSLVVAPEVTLTLSAGTTLCFHDKAALIVRGRLIAEGTVDEPVVMAGDRTGNVVADISFDIMSRQWKGVFFTPSSSGNTLSHTIIKNTTDGLVLAGDTESGITGEPQLSMLNCRLRNSGDMVLMAYHSSVEAVGCEFAEASQGLIYLQGGQHTFNHCTIANYYLFTALGGPAIQLAHLGGDEKGLDDGSGLPYTSATFDNCIVYGNGTELSHGDLNGYDIYFRCCLLKSEGSDDDNFLACLWDSDPLYYTVREDYIFDYRLKPESPAIGVGDPALTSPAAAIDGYGLSRGTTPDLGAYVFTAPEE